MKFRSKSYSHPVEVATESMNDIMFFLLLFFLMVSTLANTNAIKLLLPNSKASEKTTSGNVTLSVTADMQYYIEDKAVPSDQLETSLSAALAGKDNPVVILRVDQSLTVQQLVEVLQLGDKLKVKMVLATKKN